MAQMQEMLQAMENRLVTRITRSEQRTTARIDQLSTRIDQTNVRTDQTNVRTDQLAQTLVANDAKTLARVLSSTARQGMSLLHPLPLPNGNSIPEGKFPATYGLFRQLEAAPLLELLQLYELSVPPGALLDDMQRTLAKAGDTQSQQT